MESYSVGERIFLQFRVENLQKDKFILGTADTVKPYYKLTLGKDTLVEKGTVDVVDEDMLKLVFEPTKVGQHALDIWYYVRIGETGGDSDTTEYTSDAYECRTVRFLLPVVR